MTKTHRQIFVQFHKIRHQSPINVDNVLCHQNPSLTRMCPFTSSLSIRYLTYFLADAYTIRTRQVCNHGHDVSVVCNTPKIEESASLQVRLSGGRHFREGRVEVKINNQWGALCSNDFT